MSLSSRLRHVGPLFARATGLVNDSPFPSTTFTLRELLPRQGSSTVLPSFVPSSSQGAQSSIPSNSVPITTPTPSSHPPSSNPPSSLPSSSPPFSSPPSSSPLSSSPPSTVSSIIASFPSSSSHSSSSSSSSSHSTSTTSVSADTTITSAIVVTVNGQLSTSYTAIPTILNNQTTAVTPSQRIAIIAGSVIGGFLFVLLIACLWFFYRRLRSRQQGYFNSFEPKSRSTLLAGEDIDDDHRYTSASHMLRYAAFPSRHGKSSSTDSSPRLMRARASESGSIFHEGVWPPPGERSKLVDPIRAASDINLARIIDEVMGDDVQNGSFRSHRDFVQDTSVHSSSSWREGSSARGMGAHKIDISISSASGLLATHSPQPSTSLPTSPSTISLPQIRTQPTFDPSRSTTSLGSGGSPKNWLERSPRKMDSSPTKQSILRGTPPPSPNPPFTRFE